VKFDYYVLNTYHPSVDGEGPELYAKLIEQVTLAEALGFDCAWFTEHHFGRFGGMLPSPQLLMAALAQRTRRIRLGTAVVLLPMHHPLRIAEETAELDILCNGRLNVGVGRGMVTQPFHVFGADGTDQRKFEEQVEMLVAAWTESPFRWEGAYYQCPGPITVRPRPIQRPHPPVWVPANRDTSHASWIGRRGFSLMTPPWLLGFEVTRPVIEAYRAGLAETATASAGREVLAYLPVYVGETPERAREESERYWSGFREVADEERGSPSPDALSCEAMVAQSRLIFGDPDLCRRHIQRVLAELRVDRLALMFHFGGMPQELALASMRRFASEVAPAFTGATP
jgi:alkanesulfonate monooxygenase SsuD/methylene tetrahydromethanopterin reductase-like flavin-dependent oxidoreductase (luciferase family)